GHANYVSENPHFCKSALSRYPAETFIQLVREHEIPFHEKKLGQLFCDGSAQAIVTMLETECERAGVDVRMETRIEEVSRVGEGFVVQTSAGAVSSRSLVVATGGLSIPKLGATGV